MLVHSPCWCTRRAGARAVLVHSPCWCTRRADALAVLMRSLCGCTKSAGTVLRHLLCLCTSCTGTPSACALSVLVHVWCWCAHHAGALSVLVHPICWCTCFYWGFDDLFPRWLEDHWWRLQLQLLLRIQPLRLLCRLLGQLPRRLLCQDRQESAGELTRSLHESFC